MFRRFIITVLFIYTGVLSVQAQTHSQTPVEELILQYSHSSGAVNYVAQGRKMAMARILLRRTPMSSIANDVDELAVLKMQGTSSSVQASFKKSLQTALKGYDYYGRHDSRNGEVEIYILRAGKDNVSELVIYNPGILSLNSLHGDFTTQELLKLL